MAEITGGPDKKCLTELPPHLVPAGEFLLDSAYKLHWGDLSHDDVMDVGCGVESFKLFKTLFPKFRRVIALDVSKSFINYLKFYQAFGRMEYCVADITNRSTLTAWQGQMTKIVSLYCFNCLKDQKSGFENIRYLMKPGGEALILTALKNPHYECAKHLLAKPKWKLYKHLENQFTDYQAHGTGISFYQQILRELDFEIVTCTEELRFIPFPSEEAFRASELTKDKVISHHLPPNLRAEFKEEYKLALMTLNGLSPNQQLCIKTSSVKIIIRKKRDNTDNNDQMNSS